MALLTVHHHTTVPHPGHLEVASLHDPHQAVHHHHTALHQAHQEAQLPRHDLEGVPHHVQEVHHPVQVAHHLQDAPTQGHQEVLHHKEVLARPLVPVLLLPALAAPLALQVYLLPSLLSLLHWFIFNTLSYLCLNSLLHVSVLISFSHSPLLPFTYHFPLFLAILAIPFPGM